MLVPEAAPRRASRDLGNPVEPRTRCGQAFLDQTWGVMGGSFDWQIRIHGFARSTCTFLNTFDSQLLPFCTDASRPHFVNQALPKLHLLAAIRIQKGLLSLFSAPAISDPCARGPS